MASFSNPGRGTARCTRGAADLVRFRFGWIDKPESAVRFSLHLHPVGVLPSKPAQVSSCGVAPVEKSPCFMLEVRLDEAHFQLLGAR